MEKDYLFVKRIGGTVFYRLKGSEESIQSEENTDDLKQFLIDNVEGYTTPYPPGPPLPPTSNPYVFEIVTVEDRIEAKITYKDQLLTTQTYSTDFTYSFEGESYTGEEAVSKELEILSTTAGFFVDSQAFPAYTPPPEENLEDAIKAKIEELQKLGDALLDAAANLLPTEDDVIELLAQKEPSIAKVIKLIRQEQKENEEAGMSKEEAKEKADEEIKKMLENYKKALKDFVKAELKKMKDNITVFAKAVKAIPEDVANAIAAIALPPAIGAPPVAPNPAYALLLVKQVKNALGVTLSSAVVAFGVVMASSLLLKIELPEPLVTTYTVLLTLSTVINSLPV
jgi:hypothetical protein